MKASDADDGNREDFTQNTEGQELLRVDLAECDGVFEMLRKIENRPIIFDAMHPQHSESDPVSTAWNEVAADLIVNGKKVTGKCLNRQLKNNNNIIVNRLLELRYLVQKNGKECLIITIDAKRNTKEKAEMQLKTRDHGCILRLCKKCFPCLHQKIRRNKIYKIKTESSHEELVSHSLHCFEAPSKLLCTY